MQGGNYPMNTAWHRGSGNTSGSVEDNSLGDGSASMSAYGQGLEGAYQFYPARNQEYYSYPQSASASDQGTGYTRTAQTGTPRYSVSAQYPSYGHQAPAAYQPPVALQSHATSQPHATWAPQPQDINQQ